MSKIIAVLKEQGLWRRGSAIPSQGIGRGFESPQLHQIDPRSGRSAVWLAHLLWEQGAEGSNPFAPTSNNLRRYAEIAQLVEH